MVEIIMEKQNRTPIKGKIRRSEKICIGWVGCYYRKWGIDQWAMKTRYG